MIRKSAVTALVMAFSMGSPLAHAEEATQTQTTETSLPQSQSTGTPETGTTTQTQETQIETVQEQSVATSGSNPAGQNQDTQIGAVQFQGVSTSGSGTTPPVQTAATTASQTQGTDVVAIQGQAFSTAGDGTGAQAQATSVAAGQAQIIMAPVPTTETPTPTSQTQTTNVTVGQAQMVHLSEGGSAVQVQGSTVSVDQTQNLSTSIVVPSSQTQGTAVNAIQTQDVTTAGSAEMVQVQTAELGGEKVQPGQAPIQGEANVLVDNSLQVQKKDSNFILKIIHKLFVGKNETRVVSWDYTVGDNGKVDLEETANRKFSWGTVKATISVKAQEVMDSLKTRMTSSLEVMFEPSNENRDRDRKKNRNKQYFDVIYRNADSINKEDLESYMSTISKNSEAYEQTRLAILEMFSTFDLKVSIDKIQLHEVKETSVKVKVWQTIKKLNGPEFQDNQVEIIHTLVKEDGQYKILNSEILQMQNI
ncbi:hypothetical protein [Effusibacillus lacus]|uniref:Uncharacterized protein n=1 Tax=Effusibacillus lacus TaxID=1348429 RepID=A0A292YHU0_9BACL|nr:hypothetical protein [Effusibacillus lacus]TCS70825.1 hypothetical protein EDD64_13056 [Effusibacillus lacus]GAX89378.1 hypothetical protein EFBL_0996 [Effusibacillus lacus]